MACRRRELSSRLWGFGAAVVVLAALLAAGLRARLVYLLVNWEALEALASALRVWRGADHPSLSLIGFGRFPLAPLVFVPLSRIAPGLAQDALLQPLAGAAAAALCTWWLAGCFAAWGARPWLAAALAGLFWLNPLALSAAASGAPAAFFAAALLVALAALACWVDAGGIRELTISSFAFAAAALADPMGVLIALAAAGCVAWLMRTRPQADAPYTLGPLARAGGAALFFILPAAYMLGLWFLAAAAIGSAPDAGMARWWAQLSDLAHPANLRALSSACPLAAGIFLAAAVLAGRRMAAPLAPAAIVAAPLAAIAALGGRGRPLELSALAPAALAIRAAALMALAWLVAAAGRGELRAESQRAWAAAACGALAAALWCLAVGCREPVAPFSGRLLMAGSLRTHLEAAKVARQLIAAGRGPVYVSLPGGTGFAVQLLCGDFRRIHPCAELPRGPGALIADVSSLPRIPPGAKTARQGRLVVVFLPGPSAAESRGKPLGEKRQPHHRGPSRPRGRGVETPGQ